MPSYNKMIDWLIDSLPWLHWLPVQQRIEYKLCVLVYKCLYQAVYQHTSLNCAHRCLNQSIVVTSVQLLGVTLQFHAPEQWDTANDVLMFLVQHSGTPFLPSLSPPFLLFILPLSLPYSFPKIQLRAWESAVSSPGGSEIGISYEIEFSTLYRGKIWHLVKACLVTFLWS